MTDDAGSVWERWGAELHRARVLAGKTQAEVARAALLSRQQIGALERGTRSPKPDHAKALDDVLATGGSLYLLWGQLTDHREIPGEWRDFVLLERQSEVIREYQPVVIPGLLQAPAYARSVISRGSLGASAEQLEQAVTARTSRIAELKPHTALRFVLDETVIRRTLDSPEVMQEQLDYLLRLIDNKRIRVSLVPRHAPHRPIALSPFRVMNLDDGRQVAHVEHLLGRVVVDRAIDIQKCLARFDDLQAEALSICESVSLIEKARKELS